MRRETLVSSTELTEGTVRNMSKASSEGHTDDSEELHRQTQKSQTLKY